MKKLLALVLALVMTLGLATVSTGAAYTDKDDIDYSEAADVMTAVGVFQGKGDNFAPKDNLNRAEAAKLIAYLMLGNSTAEAIKGTGTRFTDVPADHWAVGYIEYLATSGIVSGVGNGKFDPNGQVTTVAFAKMLDVALGYDAQIEGFVGEGWNINIMKKANDNDLFEELDINSNTAITREQAAQMCLNALKAKTYEYESKGTTVSLGEAQVVVDAKNAKEKSTGTTKGSAINSDRVTAGGNYFLNLGEDLYSGDLKLDKTTDDAGHPANKWTYKTEKIGTYTNKSDLEKTFTAKVTQGALYDAIGKTVYDNLKDGKAELHYWEDGDNSYNLTLSTPITALTAAQLTTLNYYVQKDGDKKINYNPTSDSGSTGNGTVTEVFVESKDFSGTKRDVVTIVVTNTYLVKASGDYRSATEDLVFESKSDDMVFESTRLKLEDFPEIADIKKDDYILVSGHYENNRLKIDNIKKAEILTGKVEQVVVTDSVTIDGEKKSYSQKIDKNSKAETYSIGQEARVVLDKYGYIIYVDEAVSASNYVFISEYYNSGSATAKAKANAYFTDGTTSEITVKEVTNSAGTKVSDSSTLRTTPAGGSVAGKVQDQKYVGWYTYSQNSSGEYSLNKMGSSYKKAAQYLAATPAASTTAERVLNGDAVNFENANDISAQFDDTTSFGTLKANDKTIMVITYDSKNDVDVYTGVKNLPDVDFTAGTDKANIFAVMDGSYAKYVFVSLTGGRVLGSNDQNLFYVIKYDKQNKGSDNQTYYTYKAVDLDGNEISVQADSSTVFTDFNTTPGNSNIYGAYFSTSKNADGRYTSSSYVTPGTVAGKYGNFINQSNLITASNGTINFGSHAYTLDKDCKLIVVSRADALNKLKGADHEISLFTSADSVEAMLKGYSYTYDVQFKLSDNTNGRLVEAYITVSEAKLKSNLTVDIKATGVTLTGVSGADVQDVKLGNVYYVTNDAATVTVNLSGVGASTKYTLSGNYTFTSGTPTDKTRTGLTSPVTIYKTGTGDGTLTIE